MTPRRWEGIAVAFAAAAAALFLLYVNSFSEGHDGIWRTPTKVAAWVLLLAAVGAAAGGGLTRLRRRR